MLLISVFNSQGGSAASSNRNGYAPGGYTGLGLGLHLVKLSLQSMGSSVTVQSEVGRGTVFTFQLKFSEACNEEDMVGDYLNPAREGSA